MDITTTLVEGRTTLVLNGRFDAHEGPQFEAEFAALSAQLTDPTGGPEGGIVNFDLGEVGFIDSSGLAQLVRCHKALAAAGHQMRIVDMSSAVKVILEMTKLDLVFGTADQPVP